MKLPEQIWLETDNDEELYSYKILGKLSKLETCTEGLLMLLRLRWIVLLVNSRMFFIKIWDCKGYMLQVSGS